MCQDIRTEEKINDRNPFSHDTGKKSYMDSNTDNKIFLNSIHKLINNNLKGGNSDETDT